MTITRGFLANRSLWIGVPSPALPNPQMEPFGTATANVDGPAFGPIRRRRQINAPPSPASAHEYSGNQGVIALGGAPRLLWLRSLAGSEDAFRHKTDVKPHSGMKRISRALAPARAPGISHAVRRNSALYRIIALERNTQAIGIACKHNRSARFGQLLIRIRSFNPAYGTQQPLF